MAANSARSLGARSAYQAAGSSNEHFKRLRRAAGCLSRASTETAAQCLVEAQSTAEAGSQGVTPEGCVPASEDGRRYRVPVLAALVTKAFSSASRPLAARSASRSAGSWESEIRPTRVVQTLACWTTCASSCASNRRPSEVPGAYRPDPKTTSRPTVYASAFTARAESAAP